MVCQKKQQKKAYDTIFKTECGKTICRDMFGLGETWKTIKK